MREDLDVLAREFRDLLAEGKTLDDALAGLRKRGCTKIDSIRVLNTFGWCSRDAKAAVHLSAAWADVREGDDRLHDSLEEEARRLEGG
jgi:hypothetical protein